MLLKDIKILIISKLNHKAKINIAFSSKKNGGSSKQDIQRKK